jgi:hypothetical protein
MNQHARGLLCSKLAVPITETTQDRLIDILRQAQLTALLRSFGNFCKPFKLLDTVQKDACIHQGFVPKGSNILKRYFYDYSHCGAYLFAPNQRIAFLFSGGTGASGQKSTRE